MQTDRGIYHKRVCDRCGAVLGGKIDQSSMKIFSKCGDLFFAVAFNHDALTLALFRYEEYRRVIGRFNANRRRKKGQI